MGKEIVQSNTLELEKCLDVFFKLNEVEGIIMAILTTVRYLYLLKMKRLRASSPTAFRRM